MRAILITGAALAALAAALIGLGGVPRPNHEVAHEFVTALLAGDEGAARDLMNDTLRAAATTHCPDGNITACAALRIAPAWGSFEGARLVAATDHGAVFRTYWAEMDAAVLLAVYYESAGDATRITGFAGFLHDATAHEACWLAACALKINAFPPPAGVAWQQVGRFGGMSLVDADFSGQNLRGADFRDADLRGADFSAADLSYADLARADLRGADFHNAILHGANLNAPIVSTTDFSAADLGQADLSFLDATDVSFAGARLAEARIFQSYFVRVDWRGANLRDARIQQVSLWEVDFSAADFTGSTWTWLGTVENVTLPDGTRATAAEALVEWGAPAAE